MSKGWLAHLFNWHEVWIGIFDIVLSVALFYFGGKGVEFLIAVIQLPIVMVIYAIAKENAAWHGRR